MSIVNTRPLRRLWATAQTNPEWATTRLWEYIFNKMVFPSQNYLVSSQQPPTHNPGDLRRVDVVVEEVDDRGGPEFPLIFLEAKRAVTTPGEVGGVEAQAYTAACAYAVARSSREPIWAMTCVGSKARLWAFSWNHDFLIPFYPDTNGCGAIEEYIEISTHGTELLERLEYVKRHRTPPRRVLRTPSPPRPADMSVSPPWTSDDVAKRDREQSATRQGPGTTSVPEPPVMAAVEVSCDVNMADAGYGEEAYQQLSGTGEMALVLPADNNENQEHDPLTGWEWPQVTSDAGGTAAAGDMPPLPTDDVEELWETAGTLSSEAHITQSIQTAVPDTPQNTSPTGKETGSTGPSSTADRGGAAWSKVTLRKKRHFGRSELVFITNNNREKSTQSTDWAETRYKGKTAWVFLHRGTHYYTREKPTA
ncbi:hypothetical protein VTK73DRAFT_10162 [Phialemonium thermophilum]|uniref:Type I restriction enzyme R protein N-terminal domain-containing protein n=1 Tax=Phialemonium thermophilum TaxID=223376 RepID=A0ABR3VY74_9PEZI